MLQKHEIDMCTGSLWRKTLAFAIPLMCSSVLQLLFNAADLAVVGKLANSDALAAVGATSSLTNLLINVLMGFSIGTNVVVARFHGARDDDAVSRAANTSIVISVIGGIIFGIIGIIFCRPLLQLMTTPKEIIDQSTAYMRIYFAGLPVIALYNFGAAILRSVGDTRRPLVYLVIAGVINVTLNLIFVSILDKENAVVGVALATILSQCVSTFLILRALKTANAPYAISWKKLKIDKPMLRMIAGVGLPAGLNGTIFSISNTLLQKSVNFFGPAVIAGCSAGGSIEAFLFCSMDAFAQSGMAFSSQNIGAKRYDRLNRIFAVNLTLAMGWCLLSGLLVAAFRAPLIGLYSSETDVILAGAQRLSITAMCYFTCGLMNTMVGLIRGLGHSLLPTLINMVGACGLRILWIYTILEAHKTVSVLYWSYPVTWSITGVALVILYIVLRCRMRKHLRFSPPSATAS